MFCSTEGILCDLPEKTKPCRSLHRVLCSRPKGVYLEGWQGLHALLQDLSGVTAASRSLKISRKHHELLFRPWQPRSTVCAPII